MPKQKRKPRTKADDDAKTRITVELIRNSAKIIGQSLKLSSHSVTDDSEPPAGVLFLNLMGRPPSTIKNITSLASASRIILLGGVSSPVRGNSSVSHSCSCAYFSSGSLPNLRCHFDTSRFRLHQGSAKT